MDIPKTFEIGGKSIMLERVFENIEAKKIFIAIDFDRSFEEEGLDILPVKIFIS